jgi:uncharacterized protein (TIGR00369 family)
MPWLENEGIRGAYPDPALLALSGADRMKAGERHQMPRPPIHHLVGLTPVSASSASVTFSMPISPWLQNSIGTFFAGTSALVADAPLGSAVMVQLGPGKIVVTSDLSLNYLRPINLDSGQLIARARPIEVGKRVGLAEALIEDGRGRLIAHATTRCFVISIDPPDAPDEFPVLEAPTFDTPDPHERPLPRGPVSGEIWNRETFAEVLARQRRGEVPEPPFARLFGMDEVEGGDGRFGCSMNATPWLSSPSGTVYGGILAYFADASLSSAFSSVLERDEIVAPLDLKVQYLRPVAPDGAKLRCDAEVVHRGRSFATARAEIRNASGKTVALASSSATIITGRSWSSFAIVDDAPSPNDSEAQA